MKADTPAAELHAREEAVLILAPTAKDARLCRSVLAEAALSCEVTNDVGELCRAIDAGAGLAVLSEEARRRSRGRRGRQGRRSTTCLSRGRAAERHPGR